MSQAMKDSMIKDLEASIKVMEKYPEEIYTLFWDHEWINSLYGEELVHFPTPEEDPKLRLPKIKYKDLKPALEVILQKIKDSDPNSRWIETTYVSQDWCSVLNFVNDAGYDEFGY